jgi:hypothetical protein
MVAFGDTNAGEERCKDEERETEHVGAGLKL